MESRCTTPSMFMNRITTTTSLPCSFFIPLHFTLSCSELYSIFAPALMTSGLGPEERDFSRTSWSPLAYQTPSETDTMFPTQNLSGRTIVNHYAHMTRGQSWTAEDYRIAAEFNPLPNDHRGRREHDSNGQNRHELYLLGPGEKKVTEEPDTSKSFYKLFIFLTFFPRCSLDANKLVC